MEKNVKRVYRVLIGPSSFAELNSEPLAMLQEAGCEVVPNPYSRRYAKDEIISLLKGIDGLIAGLEPLDKEVLSSSRELKAISRCGAGMSNVDIPAAQELGIKVRNTPDAPTQSVAEMTVAGLLALLRKIPEMNSSLHAKQWNKQIGTLLAGKTVAIIGFGRIGQRVAALLKPFGVTILAVDPYLDAASQTEYRVVDIGEALSRADVFLLHLAGDDCVLGASEFDSMKSGAVILNAARGSSVDESALIQALDTGKVAGAWLDALPSEPYKGRLCDCQQVILTPHAASYTKECRLEMESQAAQNLIDALNAA